MKKTNLFLITGVMCGAAVTASGNSGIIIQENWAPIWAAPALIGEQARGLSLDIHEHAMVNDGVWRDDSDSLVWGRYNYTDVKNSDTFDAAGDIHTFNMGFDVQYDDNARLGGFVSTRHGTFDMTGTSIMDGTNTAATKTKIYSYLLGGYSYLTFDNFWLTNVAYGGIHQTKLDYEPGITMESLAAEFGTSAQLGYKFRFDEQFTISPIVNARYTMITYGDLGVDNASYVKMKATPKMDLEDFDNLHRFDVDIGIKFAQTFGTTDGVHATLHLTPSVARSFNDTFYSEFVGMGDYHFNLNKTIWRIGGGVVMSVYNYLDLEFGARYNQSHGYKRTDFTLGAKLMF
ncbi:MAG: autotransporter outer membrane beta-barrel domain-containing protein [Rickettsiales bacterium]|nr:autotransporter outer membrane beta-barrel domain-containing protein [Rickettsiales bacterium]